MQKWSTLHFWVKPLPSSKLTGNMAYTVRDCKITEYDHNRREQITYSIVKNNCPVDDENGKIQSLGHRKPVLYFYTVKSFDLKIWILGNQNLA